MMHQMNRSATAKKLEDPDGFRRTPVSAPLPRRGTDAGRRRGQSAVSSLYSPVRPGRHRRHGGVRLPADRTRRVEHTAAAGVRNGRCDCGKYGAHRHDDGSFHDRTPGAVRFITGRDWWSNPRSRMTQ
jgi:hypothetical protein